MNWDDARYFLAVAREGQMLGAARRLGVSQALLSRHIAALEKALGTRLLDRTTRGCSLTTAGQDFLGTAEHVEEAMENASGRLNSTIGVVTGTVRIGSPDGFGSAFLAPRLGALRSANPGLHVQLVPISRGFSLSQREADLAVMVGRPKRGRLRVRRLTDYTLGLYASRSYLDRVGSPTTLEDLARHTKVGYVEDLVYTPELHYATELVPGWNSDIEVSTAIGQLEAVRGGAGIGVLHDFMAAHDDNLVHVLPGLSAQRSYWIVWHENVGNERRVKATIAFLEQTVRATNKGFVLTS